MKIIIFKYLQEGKKKKTRSFFLQMYDISKM